MSFFQQLSALATGVDVTMRIKEKNGKLTLSLLPSTGTSNISLPAKIMTGTPQELDDGFFAVLTTVIEENKGIVVNDAQQVKEQVNEAPTGKEGKAVKTKSSKTETGKKKSGKVKKEAETKEQSLFSAPAPEKVEDEPEEEVTNEVGATPEEDTDTETE